VGYKRDEQGEVVLSKLDEATLQEIAQVSGGQYYRATADASELASLTSELGTLQKGELSALLEVQQIERFQPFLLAAVALMVAMEIIPDRLRRIAKQRTAMRGQWAMDSGQ
jgi:Ca-activated chloride channel family protein